MQRQSTTMHTGCIAVFLLFLSFSNGLYVVMREGKIRCAYMEVPRDTLLAGDFLSEPLSSDKNLGGQDIQLNPIDPLPPETAMMSFNDRPFGIRVTITSQHDPHNPIHSRVYGKSGRFAVTSTFEGEYAICFVSNITSRRGPWAWKLSVDLHHGAQAQDYEALAKKEHMDNLQLKVRKLLDRADDVRRELNYQKHREEEFRNTSENTNTRAVWWSVIQMLIVIATAYIQIRNLKSFFIKKKIK